MLGLSWFAFLVVFAAVGSTSQKGAEVELLRLPLSQLLFAALPGVHTVLQEVLQEQWSWKGPRHPPSAGKGVSGSGSTPGWPPATAD